ncbi:MAG: ribosome small subunit-dependent GTPase A [Candidatus Paceibacterota bacterium]|jgi:ribosome biogenesis GTPase
MKVEDLGYSAFFETNRNKLGLGDFAMARVIAEFKEAYRIKDADGEYPAKITGKRMFEASSREDYPAVGDWVAIAKADDDLAVIHGILPRATVIKRKYGDKVQIIAANVDVAFVVESVDRDYNLNRFERYFAIAQSGGVRPAIVLNKVDLLSREESDERRSQLESRFPGVDILFTSVVQNEGLDELRNYIATGKTYCFLGSSGVGKSSLINKLLGNPPANEAIRTDDISSYSGRGKHVTTGRQMYVLTHGGIVIDNPGMRQVGMGDASGGIDAFFDQITVLAKKCRYVDCTHAHEPGCEVTKAVASGKLDKEKYANYVNLKKEAKYCEMDDVEKRVKDRQFGKFLKKAKEGLKDLGHKDW